MTERDVTGLVGPALGAVVNVDAAPGTVPLDATGELVEEVSEFFATMLACGASFSSLRSYGLALLRWWRLLSAIDVPWQRASRIEARDFGLWMRLVFTDHLHEHGESHYSPDAIAPRAPPQDG